MHYVCGLFCPFPPDLKYQNNLFHLKPPKVKKKCYKQSSIILVTNSTKKNLELRAEAEHGACAGKLAIAKRAKELGFDAIHDTVHEMAKDEARHGCGFDGLLKRYFS